GRVGARLLRRRGSDAPAAAGRGPQQQVGRDRPVGARPGRPGCRSGRRRPGRGQRARGRRARWLSRCPDVPGPLPAGEPVPAAGAPPAPAAEGVGRRPFGIYVHVPFCQTRCGYCDFNTYTATELGPGASRDSYAGLAAAEIRLARRVLGAASPPVTSVFFGGGTPTLLPPAALAGILRGIDGEFGLAGDAEVTGEANPETVDPRGLARLRAARL